eukprot:TRINITY_DN6245_c0_g1_i1.p1 TRINITY_DN6245_c0_g1~~TRINITY_DN6245_c0_g1_i1.p1  ORF type:complete len:123 (-),score=36.17 TRINITY_DN6245_c0_g1_i1:15-383(-)
MQDKAEQDDLDESRRTELEESKLEESKLEGTDDLDLPSGEGVEDSKKDIGDEEIKFDEEIKEGDEEIRGGASEVGDEGTRLGEELEVGHDGAEPALFGDEIPQIGRAVQQECRDRSRMPSSA